jgi:hypothetical protein
MTDTVTDTVTDARAVLQRYFVAFNAGDIAGMLDCLSDDEGKVRHGKALFAEFCAHMSRCYREELTDMVLFSAADGTRVPCRLPDRPPVGLGCT